MSLGRAQWTPNDLVTGVRQLARQLCPSFSSSFCAALGQLFRQLFKPALGGIEWPVKAISMTRLSGTAMRSEWLPQCVLPMRSVDKRAIACDFQPAMAPSLYSAAAGRWTAACQRT